jgi:DNA-binding CsgD family transcriptional regulator
MTTQFTEREKEIIRLMCEGTFSNKELAQALSIEPRTVHEHLANIYHKLRELIGRTEVTRMDLLLYAILAGYADTGKLRVKYAIPDERMAAAAPL